MSHVSDAPADVEGPLTLQRFPGRLRALHHWFLGVPVVIAAWSWFGLTGTVPVVIWWWQRRPVASPGIWHIDPGRARAARLGPWRTWVALRGHGSVEIFNDELSSRDLARLRRNLKAQLAAGLSTSRRSTKPGNKMVSSDRGKVSG